MAGSTVQIVREQIAALGMLATSSEYLQDWIDQAAREGQPLTVASLAALCRQALVTPFP